MVWAKQSFLIINSQVSEPRHHNPATEQAPEPEVEAKSRNYFR